MVRNYNKNVFSDTIGSGMDGNLDKEMGIVLVLKLREAGWRSNKDEPAGEPGP